LIGWPGGYAPYAYGGLFHAFLAERFGEATLRELVETSSGRLPYIGSTAFARVYGRSAGALWSDFEAYTRERSPERATDATRATRLTRHGSTVTGPRYAPGGGLYYSISTPHAFPALMMLRNGERSPRQVATRASGSRIGFAGG